MSARPLAWPCLLAACFAAFLLAACQPAPLCPEPRDGHAVTCQVSIAIRDVPVVEPGVTDE